jgi:hypothetical protein
MVGELVDGGRITDKGSGVQCNFDPKTEAGQAMASTLPVTYCEINATDVSATYGIKMPKPACREAVLSDWSRDRAEWFFKS